MSHVIPKQHPAVVLRSHYAHLRNLLAVATVAVVGLSGAVVILASDQADENAKSSATSVESANPVGSPRYFEGVQESSRANAPALPSGTRFDGGPDEGTRGITAVPSGTRFDGGPDEGTRGMSAPGASTD